MYFYRRVPSILYLKTLLLRSLLDFRFWRIAHIRNDAHFCSMLLAADFGYKNNSESHAFFGKIWNCTRARPFTYAYYEMNSRDVSIITLAAPGRLSPRF